MITYNQEMYIRQAVESVLSQDTDFPYELVIGDDCSTDDTSAICLELQQENPEKIRLLVREQNLGMAGNFFSTLKECSGQYLAILEGDDFWTDSHKLQRQADFLDANPNFTIVFTRTETFYQDQDREGHEIPGASLKEFTMENLLKVNFIANCSVMYRQNIVVKFPDWFSRMDMLDWPLHVLYAQQGGIGFIDEKMAAYRIHSQSNYSSRKALQNYFGIYHFYTVINLHLNYKYAKLIHQLQSRTCQKIARLSRVEGHWLDFFRFSILKYLHLARSLLVR
jgi:glycosyltransferase involved in cell wall biosynthesis